MTIEQMSNWAEEMERFAEDLASSAHAIVVHCQIIRERLASPPPPPPIGQPHAEGEG